MSESSPYDDIWVQCPDAQAMCALINNDRGWLMYLHENGDPGFSSRNPNYDGPADAEIEYVLSNGQGDRYPASWALPCRTLEFFEREHRPPPFVVWHNDSGDGASIG